MREQKLERRFRVEGHGGRTERMKAQAAEPASAAIADVRWPVGVRPSTEFAAVIGAARTTDNLFITGKAGTGKSTLLRCLRANLHAKTAVLAPTGLAAINVQGQTIHSFFGFPPQLITPEVVKRARRGAILRSLDTLIIDEVSMVRADLMEGIDLALRIARKTPRVPFGGVQLLALGDLHQLPPVVRERELQEMFGEAFGGVYFFNAPVFREAPLSLAELTHVFRQNDPEFLDALNGIREGRPERDHLAAFNARVAPFLSLPDRDDYIVLTPINQAADNTNRVFLDRLAGTAVPFEATVTGKFEPTIYPTDAVLTLKEGCKVVLLRNDSEKRWVNGTQAKVSRIRGQTVWIEIAGDEYELEPVTWENIRYEHDPEKDRVVEKVVGSFRQLPVRLAWALTIHKSQGMTLDKVFIDFGRGAFAHGQAYVALSRCRSLDGMALARPITSRDVIFDERALGYRSLFPALKPRR
jgi:energy-coupling factor transporter ATP-binding protein EcfA2